MAHKRLVKLEQKRCGSQKTGEAGASQKTGEAGAKEVCLTKDW